MKIPRKAIKHLKVEWDTRESDVEVTLSLHVSISSSGFRRGPPTYILVDRAAKGVSVVALAATETTDSQHGDVEVAQGTAASENIAEKSVRCCLGVAARSCGALGAGLDAAVLDRGVVVDWNGLDWRWASSDSGNEAFLGHGAGDKNRRGSRPGSWVLVGVAGRLVELLQTKSVEEATLLRLLGIAGGCGSIGERLWGVLGLASQTAAEKLVGGKASESALCLAISGGSASEASGSQNTVGEATSRNGGGASQDGENGVVLHFEVELFLFCDC